MCEESNTQHTLQGHSGNKCQSWDLSPEFSTPQLFLFPPSSRRPWSSGKHLTEGLSCSEKGRGAFLILLPSPCLSGWAKGKACLWAAGEGAGDLLVPPVLGQEAPRSGGEMRAEKGALALHREGLHHSLQGRGTQRPAALGRGRQVLELSGRLGFLS